MKAPLLIVLLAAALFAVRVTAPSDLMDNDQERPASYVLDAVVNGHWLVQRDWTGAIASKPPLYTWLAGAAMMVLGPGSLVALYLPAGLGTVGVALLILYAGNQYFAPIRRMGSQPVLMGSGTAGDGRNACRTEVDGRDAHPTGLFAALAYLASYVALKQMALVRTDGVFAFWVTAGALLAYRAWETGRGWTWFWLVGAAATLTKGPLGVVFAAGGLTAALWERRPVRGRHWWGVALFLVITAGWFVLAYREAGQPLVDRLLGRELFGHVVRGAKGARPLEHFYLAPLYFVGRFLPWSLVAGWAMWRLWRQPSAHGGARRFERFLFCWVVLGVGVLSLAAHQRGDLVFPLVPAAALLAGRQLAQWSPRWMPGAMAMTVLVFSVVQFHVIGPRKLPVQRTEGMRQLAQQIGRQPVAHVDSPYALQFFLGTMQPLVSYAEAARQSNGWVVARDRTQLPGMVEVARWPATGVTYLSVLTYRE